LKDIENPENCLEEKEEEKKEKYQYILSAELTEAKTN
jgi:hypothetical protein